jgi:hypothetical protein
LRGSNFRRMGLVEITFGLRFTHIFDVESETVA